MKTFFSIVTLLFLVNCSSKAQTPSKEKKTYKIEKTDTEWKNQLSPIQYYVLRQAGTERPFTSAFNKNKSKGTYICAACKTPLYKSKHKFDSGTGWPSFDRAIKENVEFDVDYKIGYARTELKCSTCGGHLGHSFNDGPSETKGKRHCINGVSLAFIPEEK
jgi:peptide-methionine (R)-S-oxide reductase